jgi:glycosyltransferase involved in cell wall biosynthesis
MKIALAGLMTGRGGIQTHYFWLCRALLEAGHQVLLISLGDLPDSHDEFRIDQLCGTGHFRISFPCAGPVGLRTRGWRAAWKIWKSLREFQPLLYLVCGTGWNLFLPAVLSGGKPRLVFHEVMSGEATGWRDSRWAVRWAFHEVVAQAFPVGRNFARSFRWRKAVPVLPAFPEPLEITAQLPGILERLVPMGTAKAALFSRLVPHKQALWLTAQWPGLAPHLAELHIYGTGPEETAIRELITARGWQDRVFCHGAYPEGQDYVDLLSSFDLTLLPTIGAEGAPLVLLESMACGIPFVAFDVGGIPDYANPGCTCVPASHPDFFVAEVIRMTGRLAAGEIQRRHIRKFYLDRYGYEHLKAAWLAYMEAT